MVAVVGAPRIMTAMIQISVAHIPTIDVVQPDLTTSVHMNVAEHMSHVAGEHVNNAVSSFTVSYIVIHTA